MAKREYLSTEVDIADYLIIAIHSQIPIAQMAWRLDNTFSSSFWLMERPLENVYKKTTSSHDCYMFAPAQSEMRIWLLNNHGENGFLSNTKPRADILMVIKAENQTEIANAWLTELNDISEIALAYIVNDNFMESLKWLGWLSSDTEDWKNKTR